MKNNGQKQKWLVKISACLPNLYYVGMLVSLIFIIAQVFYAKRSIVESSEWEKAKMTIENIERFKLEMSKSPLAGTDVWMHADDILPDFSTPNGWNSTQADTLRSLYTSLFDDGIKSIEDVWSARKQETERMIDAMNVFAYPIIMGYASEMGSFQNVVKEYYSYGAFIMPNAFKEYPNVGLHAKLLYRLWRIRTELLVVDIVLKNPDKEELGYIKKKKDSGNMLFFEETEVSEASLKKYRKKLDKELQKMQGEIEDFRKISLE
ncbi:MAG: hypothetical protein LBH58_06600 [Tannerellaceae bacterium]|jgi:hypothetical protein|nr:hypothetical protein [Tannerellaceae bacterium]